MNEMEAIEVLSDFNKQVTTKADGAYQSTIGEMACKVAIKALQEIERYRAIGTVEECHTAVEKQTPFRPDQENLIAGVGRCKCGAEFIDRSTAYCGNCGQKLDWGGGKDE